MVFQDLWIDRPACMLLSRKNGSLQNDHVLYVLFTNSPNWTKPCFNLTNTIPKPKTRSRSKKLHFGRIPGYSQIPQQISWNRPGETSKKNIQSPKSMFHGNSLKCLGELDQNKSHSSSHIRCTPAKNNMTMEEPTIWRCISYLKVWFSIAMLLGKTCY